MLRPPFRTTPALWLVTLAAILLTGCPPRQIYDTYELPGIIDPDPSSIGSVSVMLRPEENSISICHFGEFDSVAVVRLDGDAPLSLGTFDLTKVLGAVDAGTSCSSIRDMTGSHLTSRYEIHALYSAGTRQRLLVRYRTTVRAYAEQLGAL